MPMRRFVAWMVAGCLLLGGCQAAETPSTSPTTTAPPSGSPTDPIHRVAALAYCKDDSLDPYRAVSHTNRDLAALLYEGLTAIEPDRTVTCRLAETVTQTDPTHLTVTLRKDAVFSDNTAVTADDVLSSFEAARTSGEYRALVQNIRQITHQDGVLTVTLYTPDTVLSQAALSFPVIRKVGDTVLGSGPYHVVGETLADNPCDGEKPLTASWKLVNLTNRREMRYALSAGQISLYTADLTDSMPPVLSGNLRETTLVIPHLIYLGVNATKTALREAVFRQGLSCALDRADLAEHAFGGYAEAAVNPFFPSATVSADLAKTEIHENNEQTVAKWTVLGYNVLGKGGNKSLPPLTLLVSADNPFHHSAATLVAKQLADVGLTVTVSALSAADFRTAVRKGQFDLYLSEVRLTADGSLRPWLTSTGAANVGIQSEAMTAYAAYLGGETSAVDYNLSFLENLPFIPLIWRKGAVVSAAACQGLVNGPRFYDQLSQWTM